MFRERQNVIVRCAKSRQTPTCCMLAAAAGRRTSAAAAARRRAATTARRCTTAASCRAAAPAAGSTSRQCASRVNTAEVCGGSRRGLEPIDYFDAGIRFCISQRTPRNHE
jgi:hypothetical protein